MLLNVSVHGGIDTGMSYKKENSFHACQPSSRKGEERKNSKADSAFFCKVEITEKGIGFEGTITSRTAR